MSITPKRERLRQVYVKFMDPKEKTPLVSWWAEPNLQKDRVAFQQQLIACEIARLNSSSQRFGGNKPTHDKFSTWPKSPK